MRPVLAVSIGCPAGIGPEVAVRAAAKLKGGVALLVGDEPAIRRGAQLVRVAQRRLVSVKSVDEASRLPAGRVAVYGASVRLARPVAFGRPTRGAGAAQLAWVDQALELTRTGGAAALVTGPVSKKAIAGAGFAEFRGHTEHLAARLDAPEVVMAFASGTLLVALVTTHLPIGAVPAAITPEAVTRACYWCARLCRDLGHARPTIAVAALNPHAGEGGLLGAEEDDRIKPGIAWARRRLRLHGVEGELVGPIGAETAFRHAVEGRYRAVVAMYHDQATIPCKLLGFGEAVNVTLGLPIVRTSVDHGTGYDIAGRGVASDRGMRAAMDLALRLAHKSSS